jgi:putative tricarboxylic transport membrane protein
VVLYFRFAYGAMIEENVRRALLLSRGDVLVNLQRPIVMGMIAFMCLVLLTRFTLMKYLNNRRVRRVQRFGPDAKF